MTILSEREIIMAQILGYCKDCGMEILDIDEEYMITGEPTGMFECFDCRKMWRKEDIAKENELHYMP